MDYQIMDVKERLLCDNDEAARQTRAAMRRKGVYFINLMGSPGAGKTSSLLRLGSLLGDRYRIGVMEADVESDVDAAAVAESGMRAVQLHTGGLCHMDADMTARGLDALELSELDLVVLENVGNLVCPAEFDVGADLRMMILSVPEGDDKPLKYPLMFSVSDVLLINKIDTAPIFDFDYELACQRARALNPMVEIFPVCARTGKGFPALAEAIARRIEERRREQ